MQYNDIVFTEIPLLVSDAYRDASIVNADMRSAMEALENIRNAALNKNIFATWDTIDEEIGLAETEYFQPILVTLRNRFQKMVYSKTIKLFHEEFRRDRRNGWIIWLQEYVRALSSWRLPYCNVISQEEFDFPEEAKATVRKIRSCTKLLLQQRWTEAYGLFLHLAGINDISDTYRAKMFVTTAEIYLFDLLKPNKAKELIEEAKQLAPNEPRVACCVGYYWLQLEDLEKAINQFEYSIKEDPKVVDGYVGLGKYYEKKGELMNAEDCYQDAIKNAAGWSEGYVNMYKLYGRPELFQIHKEKIFPLLNIAIAVDPESRYTRYLEIGEIYRQNYQYLNAHQWFDKSIDFDPNQVGAYVLKGYTYIEQRSFDEAYQVLRKAIEKDSNAFDGYWGLTEYYEIQNMWEEALYWYKESLARRPEWKGLILAKIARIEMNLARFDSAYDSAMNAFSFEPEIISIQPILKDLAYHYYLEGNRYTQQSQHHEASQKYERSLQCHDKLLEINPNDGEVWNSKGVISYMVQSYQDSLNYYDRALEIDSNSNWWYNKGTSLSALKRYDEAIQCYDKALEINPNDSEVWVRKGSALVELGRHDEAIQCYDKALEINPNDSYTLTKLGISFRRLRRYDEAIQCYDKALEINPNDSYALNCKAYLFALVDKNDVALPLVEKSLQIDPYSSKAFHTKGFILYNLKRYDDSIICFDEAIKFDPVYSEAWEGKGTSLSALKRYDEAIQCYDKAINFDPSNNDAHDKKKLLLSEMRA